MHWQELELSVGDTLQIGNRMLTVVDVEEGQVAFRLDEATHESAESELLQIDLPSAK